jgi:hypothetical protein
MLVIALALGLTIIGCVEDDPEDKKPETKPITLNGKWTSVEDSFIIDGNTIEIEDYAKGTFAVSGNTITITITHLNAGMLNDLFNELTDILGVINEGLEDGEKIDLPSDIFTGTWLSANDVNSALTTYLEALEELFADYLDEENEDYDEDVAEIINGFLALISGMGEAIFADMTATFSFNEDGTELTIITLNEEGEPETTVYTKEE